jgi:phage-related protein
VLGVILQLGAYLVRFIVTPLAWIVRGFALVVGAVTWTASVIVQAIISAAKFIYRVCLPVRLLAQAFVAAGRIIYGVWQILTGDGNLLSGLKTIGLAVLGFLAEPFRWMRDRVLGFWNFLTGIMGGIGQLFAWVGRTILNVFLNLPIVRLLRAVLRGVFKLFSGDISLFAAGRALIVNLGKGILFMVAWPLTVLQSMIRRFFTLFTGDAAFGDAGKGIIMGLVRGLLSVLGIPTELIGGMVRGMISTIQGGWEAIASLGQSVLGAITAPFETAASVAGAAWEGMKSAASEVLDSILGSVQGMVTRLGDLVSGLGGTVFSGALSGAWDGLVAGGQRALAAAQAAFSGITSSASSMAEGLHSVAAGIGDVATRIPRGTISRDTAWST